MSSTEIKMNGNRVHVLRSNENEAYFIIIFESGHGVRNRIKVNKTILNDLEEQIKKVKGDLKVSNW